MPEPNESKLIFEAQERAKENNLPIRPERPTGHLRCRLTAGIVIPHDEIIEWYRRTFEARYPDDEYEEQPAWACAGKISAEYRQLTSDWDSDPFTFVEVAYSKGRHDLMFIMATRRGEWMNKNGRWAVEHVFDPELQFPPMPEKEEKVREFLTKQMGFEKLGKYVTMYQVR